MIRRMLSLSSALLLLASVFGIGLSPCFAQDGEQKYTAWNLWYEDPVEMWSTLYLRGTMLPAGTPVTDVRIQKKWTRTIIIFVNENTGVEHRMLWLAKHRPGVRVDTFMDRMFTTKSRDQLLAGMKATERLAIKGGRVVKGMSREAVLVCYGYPPETGTPSLESDTWRFWSDRHRTRTVSFVNRKVARVNP